MSSTRLPLFPLSDEVHFPRTLLQLRVLQPDYCALIEDLFLDDRTDRQGDTMIAAVLLKPSWAQENPDDDVYTAGTAGRVIGLWQHEDGCDILLRGEYRFEVEREISQGPYRAAVVRPVSEPALNERDPGIQVVRSELIECTSMLSGELGSSFPLDEEQLSELDEELSFEEVVNLLAANLDLAPMRKQQLLADTLPDRALHLLSILRGRRKVLDVLRPFRHLAPEFDCN